MAHCHIVPVPAVAKDGRTIVLKVEQTGKKPLDVQVVGCDGETVYVATLQHHKLGQLRKKKYNGSDDEWEAVLSHFLLQTQPEDKHAKALDGLHMVYSMKDDDIVLVIRKDVENIKVTWGEIDLPNSELEIDPVDWARISAEAHTSAVKELADLKTKVNESQSTIRQLEKQLEDFLEAKRQSQNEMAEKFMVILNEKKKTIRDQQRLLAGAKVDKITATAVQSNRKTATPRKPGPSRTSKRKAVAKEEPVSQAAEEQMELDEETEDEEQLQEASTPDRMSGDETEDEGLESPKESASQSKGKSPDGSNTRSTRTASTTKTSNPAQTREPPPRRELPFGRRNTRNKPEEKQPSPPPAEEEDDDDETDDEEL